MRYPIVEVLYFQNMLLYAFYLWAVN